MTKASYLIMSSEKHPSPSNRPVKALDDYMATCRAIKISVENGPLFRTTSGNRVLLDAFSTDAAEARLTDYLSEAGLSNKTLYCFRCGGAITLALTDSTLDDIVDHVGWRSNRMAKYYLQLHKSLQPDPVAARMARATPETSTRYEKLNQLSGFEPAFPPQLAAQTSEPIPVTRRSPRKHKLDKL